MKKLKLANVGATGAVGQEILRVLENRNFPVKRLRCFASLRSQGKKLLFHNEEIPVELLSDSSFHDTDIALFSAGSKISLEWAQRAIDAGAVVIDNSSAFRMDKHVPLIIPEINAHALTTHRHLISSPNCSATIMLMALAPLHRHVKIKRISATTYQAASGAGAHVMRELAEETRAHLDQRPFQRTAMPFPYAFNLFPHNSPLRDNGYVEEELKMVYETHKILEDASIGVHATCVRVPIFRAHAEALNVTFHEPLSVDRAYAILNEAPGIRIVEDRANNRFPMPCDATGQDAVLCGRIRIDPTLPHTLDLWVVGDQLLKGAALNAVQIAECLCREKVTL